jgi:hypothetical protein
MSFEISVNKTNHVNQEYFNSVIKKLSHSECRVPYTYHHDYLRMNVENFKGLSRSEVASNHIEDDVELYAVALTKLLDELSFRDTMDLNNDDIIVCKKAIEITENVVARYNYETSYQNSINMKKIKEIDNDLLPF